LSYRCGIGLQAAREKLRVGRRLEELPLVREAFAAGELSYSKVRAVCRVARPETEVALLEMARYASTAQLEEIVRTYRAVTGREEMRHHNDRHDKRFARWHWDDDGSLVISARLSPEDGAAFLAALQAGREAIEATGEPAVDSGEVRSDGTPGVIPGSNSDSAESLLPEARSADALVSMATLALSAPATARRLACDATVVSLVEAADGTPLDVGRKRRSAPAALRRALWRRDRCCRFPGCGRRRFLHAHHIVHWINGGETKLTNEILLCSFHHRLVHEGGYRLETPADHVFVFSDPAGRVIPEVAPIEPASGPGLRERNGAAGLAITAETCRSLGEGEPYDLGLTIDALVAV
jgi:hypothetical protein